MADKQKTIKAPVSISGVGLHTGNDVTLTFKPAPENFGYKFKRTDIPDSPFIDADVDNVIDTSRGTTIGKNGIEIITIEHTLAAVAGLGIDNVIIELDCPETPIMDGSSKIFVQALSDTGIVEQNADKKYFKINSNISYSNASKKVEMLAVPHDLFRLSVLIDFETDVLGCQHASMRGIENFKDEIAPCRTFVFLHELEHLIKENLIKGGDLNNAIVFVNRVVTNEELDRLAALFKRQKVEVLKEGILNNVELRYTNEPARHKLLDIVGDLSLVGVALKGHIIANRPGHNTNIEFAKKIKQYIKEEKLKPQIPYFDINKVIYDVNQIKNILPHRPPFLLIDKILDLSDNHVVGLKNITMNEPFFVGHFPNNPVMPGVLQVEAMAQTGGIFALSTVPDPQNYLTYFLKIDNVRFKQKVVPGDTMIFRLELTSPIRRGIFNMKGTAYVGNKIVMEAELMAQIIKNSN